MVVEYDRVVWSALFWEERGADRGRAGEPIARREDPAPPQQLVQRMELMPSKYLTPRQRASLLLLFGRQKFGSKAAFARALGVDPANLMRHVSSPNPHINTLIRYAKVLEEDLDLFIYK